MSLEQLTAPPARPKVSFIFDEGVRLHDLNTEQEGIAVDAHIECSSHNTTITNVAFILEPDSDNPLLIIHKPLGMLGVRDLLEAVEAKGVCSNFSLDAPCPLAEGGEFDA